MSAAKPIGALLVCLPLAAVLASPAPAPAAPAPAPAWAIDSVATPTVFVPNDPEHGYSYEVRPYDSGGAPTDGGPITISDTLPKGLAVTGVRFELPYEEHRTDFGEPVTIGGETIELCKRQTAAETTTVTCTVPEEIPGSGEESALLHPGEELALVIYVAAPPSLAGQALRSEAEVEGGGPAPAATAVHNEVAAHEAPQGLQETAPAGLAQFRTEATEADGGPATTAAAHPYQLTTSFALDTAVPPAGAESPVVPAGGDLKDLEVALPPGLTGGAALTAARCTPQQFTTFRLEKVSTGEEIKQNACPDASAVGIVTIRRIEGANEPNEHLVLYNLDPAPGRAATFGFEVIGVTPFYIDTEVRPEDGYRAYASFRNATQVKRVISARVTIWGDPADPGHDSVRGHCLNTGSNPVLSLGECPAGVPERPFLRLPTSCAGAPATLAALDTWSAPGAFSFASAPMGATSGCAAVPFAPTLTAHPTTGAADSPTGLEAHLHVPQPADPEGLGEADVRKTVVALPEGLVINPSGAHGLEACSEAEVGYKRTEADGTTVFDDAAAECPAAARLGTVTVRTPLIDHPLEGSVYAAMPHANPFGSLLAIYLAVSDPQSGVVVKLAGRVELDPDTGRLTTTFDRSPQQPFEDFELHFFAGPRAPLRTPQLCGAHRTDSVLTPWSAPAAPPVSYSERYAIDRGPGGGPCPASGAELPDAFSFAAGTESPLAGAYSPLVINLSRPDGSRELSQLTLTPPPGLLARLAGIPYCPEAGIAAARSRQREGGGAEEQADPSCPAASRVGTVTVGAGAGPDPYYVRGAAYLAGPYQGAPLSLAIVTPAVAGPFDLGAVVVRSALYVNPATAQITAVSDPVPRILEGVPVDLRSVAVRLDHPGWGLNPTSCEPSAFAGAVADTLGGSAPLSSRFQVGECARLGFKPRLKLRLHGKTGRGAYPALRAVYTAREGDANLRRMALRFPRSEFIEQAHFRTICTRAQYAQSQCPPGSVYGRVRAYTPLLDAPLEGPVYLRSSNHNLPDVVFALHGQVDAEVAVRIDSANGGLRATIEHAPDVPVSKVIVEMQGGRKGLFVNSRDICGRTYRANARLAAQNGRAGQLRPALRDPRCAKHRRRKGHRRRGRGRHGRGSHKPRR
jgi:hypothetical protein